MNLIADLFSFAYVPGWYLQLDELAEHSRSHGGLSGWTLLREIQILLY